MYVCMYVVKWRQNTQVIALLHTKTPPSCCVNSQLDYEQSLELFSCTVDFNARKRETARSLAYNWRQAQFSALKGYMYIMGEKQTAHFLVQKLSFIISISMASHLVPLWNRGLWQLGNGPLVFMSSFPGFSIIHIQILQTDLYIFP